MSVWEQIKALFVSEEPVDAVFKEAWLEHLNHNLPIYKRLPDELKICLRQKIARFIATTYFEACGGLELTDEIILTIAGQACLLIVNHPGEPYPNLKTVIVYPAAFKSVQRQVDALGIVTEREIARTGESWSNGTVVLAWDSVAHGARNIFDGNNVTLHEFAHQLDQENARSDGVPILHTPEAYRTWANVLSDDFERLVDRAERGKKSVMDHYGATNMAEFFSVATESFFEKPRQMYKKHPELYQELSTYYRLDPRVWFLPS
ncbi:zinc-dependent peptidase [Rubellicoccus peritrichatus]|uniref:Zinc-dependent peptidase n=1 Tax=Rubellicoccus peritrichatus TaxID=3080537 RepID=A0AAQ3LAY9_9BACT|nr:zinc-dependent peptidase [Puniceicoccus sp. CR14]WOO40585.1 zinc-dependent peptidase [Puniceicoccus sp. CR14]